MIKGIPAGFKPNLAATMTKPELIQFPVWASPKIDGIRCTVFDGVAYSRTFKPIPNPYVQAWAKEYAPQLDSLDGELVVGSATDANCMQASMAVMSKKGEPDFTFHVFDAVLPGVEFWERNDYAQARSDFTMSSPYSRAVFVAFVPQHLCADLDQLAAKEALWLAAGYEGMMIRGHDSMYKFGRSTEREGGLVKVKRFADAEAEIIGFEEEMHNGNAATLDNFGRTERSSVKEGLVGKGALGALVVRSPDGVEFNIGTGFTAEQRRGLWAIRESLLGELVTYKFFPHGVKEAPRHPVFKNFRSKEDV